MREKLSNKPPRTSKNRAMTKKIQETSEHAKLKSVLKEIVRSCDFKFDSEVSLNFSGNCDESDRLIDERSMDAVAYGSFKGKSFLLVFECKGGSDIKGIQSKISAWEADILKIKSGKAQIISSDENEIRQSDLSKFDDIRICYVFGKSIEQERYNTIASFLNGRGFYAWDNNATTYYKKTSDTIGKAVRYHILHEFGINLESSGAYCEKAVQIKQGDLEMFVFGTKPSVLLKIGYVYRRASGKPQAYQRILNKDRITRISEFLSSDEAILPNAIIIAFDDDADIQRDIRYENGELWFPRRYCSAWIIDGQHRVFGFLNTQYEEINEDDSDNVFQLPVVAFRKLEPVLQNRTFVSINYNQKKIDPTLLCDLATALPDLRNELTWPSLLVAELNQVEPLKNKVKILELDKGKPISISSFARYGLLEALLGYDKAKRLYNGPLNKYSPFKPKATLANAANQKALEDQVDLLQRYFVAVKLNTIKTNPNQDPWQNTANYALLKTTGINALLLVLSRIMERYPKVETDMHKDFTTYLKPLSEISFKRDSVAKQGGGWKGFRNLANVILGKLNAEHSDSLRLFGEKEKK